MRLAERFNVTEFAYAHRGLWTQDRPPENSQAAFEAAMAAGLGIEFDVRPSQDGVPIVFHDPTLERMTTRSGRVEELNSGELIGEPLRGGGEIIALTALLEIWPDNLPLLCELKIDGMTDPVAFAVRVGALLFGHKGPCAGMSFDPRAVAVLPATLMRGQLLPPTGGKQTRDLTQRATVPVDYLACHTEDAGAAELQAVRSRMPVITWTVTSAEQCAALAPLCDSQIFEGFDPGLAKRQILHR